MRRVMGLAVAFGLFGHLWAEPAAAQLFGTRSFGQSLQPQSSAGGGTFGGPTPAPGMSPPPAGSGAVSGSARFLRENRSAGTFVGKDLMDSTNVGAVQVGQTLGNQPAAMEVRERLVPQVLVNPPRAPLPRTGIYEPRLYVGF